MKTETLGEITPCYRVKFVRRSKHSAARLWKALTEPGEVQVWMEGPAHIELRIGGNWQIDFNWTTNADGERVQLETNDYLDGIIIGIEAERRLAYAWGLSVCEWTIKDHESGCEYTFIQNGLSDRGEGEEGLAAGWHGFLDALDMHLDGSTPDPEKQAEHWKRRHAPYFARLNAALPKRATGIAGPGEPGR